MKNCYQDNENPREVPTKEDPGKNYPEKAPGNTPDPDPSQHNPLTPNEKKCIGFSKKKKE